MVTRSISFGNKEGQGRTGGTKTTSDWLTDWPVLKGRHQSRGQEGRDDTDERIIVGRTGGEDGEAKVEAGEEDSGPQWRHAAAHTYLSPHTVFYLLSLLHQYEDDNSIYVNIVNILTVLIPLTPHTPSHISQRKNIFI